MVRFTVREWKKNKGPERKEREGNRSGVWQGGRKGRKKKKEGEKKTVSGELEREAEHKSKEKEIQKAEHNQV